LITATIAKNTTSKAVNGKDSSKAGPSLCSEITPFKEVKPTSRNKPIIPTGAKCKPSAIIRHTPNKASNLRCRFCKSDRSLAFFSADSIIFNLKDSGNKAPYEASLNFSIAKQVNIPIMNTGIVIGAMRMKNSVNSHPALVAINRFCGSPTIVHTPPSAVPTAPCITMSDKKFLPCENSLALI